MESNHGSPTNLMGTLKPGLCLKWSFKGTYKRHVHLWTNVSASACIMCSWVSCIRIVPCAFPPSQCCACHSRHSFFSCRLMSWVWRIAGIMLKGWSFSFIDTWNLLFYEQLKLHMIFIFKLIQSFFSIKRGGGDTQVSQAWLHWQSRNGSHVVRWWIQKRCLKCIQLCVFLKITPLC